MDFKNALNLEAGLLREPSLYYNAAKTSKRRHNLLRMWHSLSRLQKNLFTIVLFFFAFCSLYAFSSFYFRATISNLPSEATAKILDDKVYRIEANFPTPIIAKQDLVKNVSSEQRLEGVDVKPVLPFPKMLSFQGPTNERQKRVVEAFKHAWSGYKKYAWGHDHLRPISKTFHNWFSVGLTIVDSLDTMIIMGLKDEFNESRAWISASLNFDLDRYVNLFETTIRVLGGLLSAFHLTGDNLFLTKAVDLGDRLLGAFNTPLHLPYSDVNLHTREPKLPSWGPDSSLSEITTIQLEFRALTHATNNPIYEAFAFNVSKHIHNLTCSNFDGLCPMFINPKTGQWRSGYTITMGARADSYYEYLLKQWLQTGKGLSWLRDDYVTAMNGMIKRLVRQSEPNKLTFIGELLNEKSFSPKMDHLVCYIVGALALGSVNGLGADHMDYAKQLARTCHEMYNNPTGLGPEIAHFNLVADAKNDIFVKTADAHCLLRPEAIEGWFYMYRLTGDKIYQDWGWQALEAIEKYAKIDAGGYSSVHNVKKVPVAYKDMQESFFLAETLKYLYLLLADDQSILPLTDFVFNTEAHPLPIYRT